MPEHGRRPLERVDLRDERRVDQPRGLEQRLVVPARPLGAQPVADGVVLEREQQVEQREADPPVVVEPGHRDAGDEVAGQQSVDDGELAVPARTDAPLRLEGAPVELRRVPPVGHVVAIRGRRQRRMVRRLRGRPADQHGRVRPGIVRVERQLVRVAGVRAPVTEPVVDLELDPRRREQVQGLRLDHPPAPAREELVADPARVRRQQRGRRVGDRPIQRNGATEARVGRAHVRLREIVVGAVGRPLVLVAGQPAGDGAAPARGRRLRAVQVLLAEDRAEREQVQHAEPRRQPVPGHRPVDQLERRGEQARQPRPASRPMGRHVLRLAPHGQEEPRDRFVRGTAAPGAAREREIGGPRRLVHGAEAEHDQRPAVQRLVEEGDDRVLRARAEQERRRDEGLEQRRLGLLSPAAMAVGGQPAHALERVDDSADRDPGGVDAVEVVARRGPHDVGAGWPVTGERGPDDPDRVQQTPGRAIRLRRGDVVGEEQPADHLLRHDAHVGGELGPGHVAREGGDAVGVGLRLLETTLERLLARDPRVVVVRGEDAERGAAHGEGAVDPAVDQPVEPPTLVEDVPAHVRVVVERGHLERVVDHEDVCERATSDASQHDFGTLLPTGPPSARRAVRDRVGGHDR